MNVFPRVTERMDNRSSINNDDDEPRMDRMIMGGNIFDRTITTTTTTTTMEDNNTNTNNWNDWNDNTINPTSSSSSLLSSTLLSSSSNSSCLFPLCGTGILSSSSTKQRHLLIPSVPNKLPSIEESERLLEDDLKKLSISDQEQLFYDLHGISIENNNSNSLVPITEEDHITQCLQEMDIELLKICSSTTSTSSSSSCNNNNDIIAYKVAYSQSPNYVQNDSFRLMFLYADLFQPKKAVVRLLRFMEEKLVLFGPDLLTKTITWNDLQVEDQQILQSGVMQTSMKTDRAKRKLIIGVPQLKPITFTLDSLMRAHYYQLMLLAQEEETQKRGIVGLMLMMDQPVSLLADDPRELWSMTRLREAIPIRICAQHMCTNNPHLKRILSFGKFAMGSYTRARHRDHFGTHVELLYKLMSFGIPPEIIPIDTSGTYKPEAHKQWLATMHHQLPPSAETKTTMAFTPITKEGEGEEELPSTMPITKNFETYHDESNNNNSNNDTVSQQQHIHISPTSSPEPSALEFHYGGSGGTGLDCGMPIGGTTEDEGFMDVLVDLHAPIMEYSSSSSSSSLGLLSSSSSSLKTTKVVAPTPPVDDDDILVGGPPNNKMILSPSPPLQQVVVDDGFIEPPKRFDVIFGRGRGAQEHSGNQRFRLIVDMHMGDYEKAGKYGKTQIAETVIRIIKESSGRFLRRKSTSKGNATTTTTTPMWEVVDDLTVRAKVSHAFRARRYVSNGHSSSSISTTST